MKRIFFIILLLPILFNAQAQSGVRFESGKNWTQVKADAAKQEKFIFVDCYATWCGPCKEMDRNIYPLQAVGAYMNDRFVSVKIQIDTTKQDSDQVKEWYPIAHQFMVQYKINALPTFLFFNSAGKLIYKESGFQKPADFVKIAQDALDYNRLLSQYQSGKINYDSLSFLTITTRKIGLKNEADKMARDYLEHLDILDDAAVANKETAKTIVTAPFLGNLSSKDKVFKLFLNQPDRMDPLLWKGASSYVVGTVITTEMINPAIQTHENDNSYVPGWAKISDKIKRKYGKDYAERTILDAKLKWYNDRKNWKMITKYTVEKIDKFGLDTAGIGKYLSNNIMYEVIFKHSTDKTELNKAIGWMQIVMKAAPDDPSILDTYANLLYKVGRKEDAIQWEEKAANINPNDISESDIRRALQKMKKGLPTWE